MRDYPELATYPEFYRSSITQNELVFVWWMRCEASPLYGDPDEKKFEQCIKMAFPTEQQQQAKREAWAALKFPDNIKAAFKRMERFNQAARVEDYVYLKNVRENCKAILSKNVLDMDEDAQKQWADTCKTVMAIMKETTKDIERGDFGVVESEQINETEGWLSAWRSGTK